MAYPQETFINTTLSAGSFIARKRTACLRETLKYQLKVLKETGRYDAFRLKHHPIYGKPPSCWPIPDHQFWDSDIAKWIEGACYFLHEEYDTEIVDAIEELVNMVASAQHDDGYINIHYTVVEPGKRFTNVRDMHELYNLGHFIEAALAHEMYFKNGKLMQPILKYVDLVHRLFGPDAGQIHGYPGHPEIELALMRLYRRTGNLDYRHLSNHFISERGNPSGSNGRHFYEDEAQKRGELPGQRPGYWPEDNVLRYYQAHKPILEQETIEGHSVRAMYLLVGLADLLYDSAETSAPAFKDALYRLWSNMVQCKMYVTGGIGAVKVFEGFGRDYWLPQSTDEGGCYSETCAAVGVVMLAERISQFDLDRRFGDIMELALYNAVLTGMSCDGKQFTYVNQLGSSDCDRSERQKWFTCACCPPNVLRMLASMGGYIYSDDTDNQDPFVNVHLFIASAHSFKIKGNTCSVKQDGNYPIDGRIQFTVSSPHPVGLRIRIPSWSDNFTVTPEIHNAQIVKGYLIIPWSYIVHNPSFSLQLDMTPRFLSWHPRTGTPNISLARGPIVYCVEDVDNAWVEDHFRGLYVEPKAEITERCKIDPTTKEQYVELSISHAAHTVDFGELRGDAGLLYTNVTKQVSSAKVVEELCFIPYYFRANRGGRGQMRVGLKPWVCDLPCQSRVSDRVNKT